MKHTHTLSICLILCSFAPLLYPVIPEEEMAALLGEAKALRMSMNNGESEPMLGKTHPAVYKLTGGREAFEKGFRAEMRQIKAGGIKALSVEALPPGLFYNSGEDLVCFIQTVSVVEADGRRVRAESFLVAARGSREPWRYLDGNPIWHNPRMIRLLFPGLPEVVRIPPSKNTILPRP
jgi:hypothetical protein